MRFIRKIIKLQIFIFCILVRITTVHNTAHLTAHFTGKQKCCDKWVNKKFNILNIYLNWKQVTGIPYYTIFII